MSAPEDRIAPGLWRLILAGSAVVVVITLAGALILAGGVADPALPGPAIWSRTADPGACLDTSGVDLPELTIPMLLELSATSTDHAAWGVAFGEGDGSQTWEVVPPGYVRYAGQTWPFHHVRNGRNTLRLELLPPAEGGAAGGRWRLWVNLERAAEGDLPSGVGRWSLLATPGVCWEQLRAYGPA